MRKILLILTALILIFSVSISVMAGPVLELDRRGSITVSFVKDKQPIPGGSVICTKVGYISREGNGYAFRREFDHVLITDLQDSDTSVELERFVNQNNITGTVKSVGKNGIVSFSDLETGLYLIRQNKAPEGYLSFRSFLVTLPYYKDGAYIYDIDASTKTELEKEPPEFTEPSTGPSEPSTGPTEPSTGPSEPSTGPSEPSTGPTEPSTGPTEPSTGPTEPSTGPTEPSTGSTVPSESSDSSASTGPTTPSDGEDSPQTGQLNWPIPVMALIGVFCVFLGLFLVIRRKKEDV